MASLSLSSLPSLSLSPFSSLFLSSLSPSLCSLIFLLIFIFLFLFLSLLFFPPASRHPQGELKPHKSHTDVIRTVIWEVFFKRAQAWLSAFLGVLGRPWSDSEGSYAKVIREGHTRRPYAKNGIFLIYCHTRAIRKAMRRGHTWSSCAELFLNGFQHHG